MRGTFLCIQNEHYIALDDYQLEVNCDFKVT